MLNWNDSSKTEPCYPDFNDLRRYIERSRVPGIVEAYELASKEICSWHNDFSLQVDSLKLRIGSVTKADNTLIVHKKKVPSASSLENRSDKQVTKADNKPIVQIESKPKIIMNGRKPKLLTVEQVCKVKRMREDGKSFKEIAKIFDVSDRTIRRCLADEYLK